MDDEFMNALRETTVNAQASLQRTRVLVPVEQLGEFNKTLDSLNRKATAFGLPAVR